MTQPISKLEELSEEQKDRIIFGIMHYQPSSRVRDRILEEVLHFKWLDCEECGLDIYSGIDCSEEQLIAAGYEWRIQHWENFYKNNDTEGKDQPRKL